MKGTVMLLSSAALALSFAVARPACAGSPPNAAVQGTWSFGSNYGSGVYTEGNGTLTFDGNGGVTGFLNLDTDGCYSIGTGLTGSYVVNPGKLSGTATMIAGLPSATSCGSFLEGDTATLAFFLANNLKTFTYVEIDPNEIGYICPPMLKRRRWQALRRTSRLLFEKGHKTFRAPCFN
jgi:hypothetical protein